MKVLETATGTFVGLVGCFVAVIVCFCLSCLAITLIYGVIVPPPSSIPPIAPDNEIIRLYIPEILP